MRCALNGPASWTITVASPRHCIALQRTTIVVPLKTSMEADMLVLTRRIGEVIRIGPHIVVTILGVNGSQVRLGIEAPKDVAVHREEVFERIKHERTTTGST